MTVDLQGFLPIMGGINGDASIQLGVLVVGEKRDASGNPQASSDLTSAKVIFGGAELPFGLDQVRDSFPKTTISMSPQGKVLKTDAPDINPPVTLPGLDVKRFPEISYLPVEFPAAGIEVGKSWSFKRQFNGSEISYTVTPSKLEGETLHLDVKLDQTNLTYEDSSGGNATKQSAYAKVTTVMQGTGTIKFDLKRGVAKDVRVVTDSTSTSEAVVGGKKTERKLKTTLNVKLRELGKSANTNPPKSRARYIGDWQLPDWASGAIDTTQRWASTAAMRLFALFMGFRRV
ncbi:MAG: hypothetical protein KF784_07835 [Fimbriimonadaceae bacterium]|nr:hypothetical protein [Fimbriimonadaceae bacterium]